MFVVVYIVVDDDDSISLTIDTQYVILAVAWLLLMLLQWRIAHYSLTTAINVLFHLFLILLLLLLFFFCSHFHYTNTLRSIISMSEQVYREIRIIGQLCVIIYPSTQRGKERNFSFANSNCNRI